MFKKKLNVHKKILVIAYYFPPSNGAGVHRTLRFVKFLPEFQWKPVVLTIKEDFYAFSQPIDLGTYQKIPKEIKVYRTALLRPFVFLIKIRDKIKGIKSQQISKSQEEKKQKIQNQKDLLYSLKNFIDNLLNTPDSEIGWLPFAIPKGLQLLRKENIKIIYTTSPPHSTHLIGLCLKILAFRPWVVDFRDPWARRPWGSEENKKSLRYKFQIFLEKLVVRFADKVILNTESMRQEFRKYYSGYSPKKFITITNGFDPDDFIGIDIQSKKDNNKFTITHAGSLYRKRNPRLFLEAIAQLQKEGIIHSDNFQVNLVGKISEEFNVESLIQELNIEKLISLIPPVSHKESLLFLANSDILLIIQPETVLQIPGKIFEYIYLKKPILALTGNGATAKLVTENGLGIVVNADNVEQIENGILELYNNRRHYDRVVQKLASDSALIKYNGKRLTGELSEVLNDCMT